MSKKHPLPHKPVEVNEEWTNLRDWAQKHAGTALTTALIVLVAVLAAWTLHSRQARRTELAAQMLSSARSTADFGAIVQQFPRSDAAPLAKLSLAKLQFDLGDYQEAMTQYQAFLDKWPNHLLAGTATLGRLFCLEAQGTPDAIAEAEAGFRQFANENEGHYLYPQARLGEARCKQQLGQLSEAREIYESFLATFPDNPWSLQIAERLASLERLIGRQQS